MKKAKPTYTTVPWKSLDDPDKFRDADRIEEAQRTPLTETQKMDADYLKSLEDAAEASQLAQKKEHKLRLDAELETSLVKAVGQNSPETKALKKEVEELKADLARAKEDHQYDNLVHKRELEKMNK